MRRHSRADQANVGTATVEYRITGRGTDPLVLLHGWPQTSYCWRRVEPLLRDRYTLLVPDLPGYGKSTWTQSDFSKRSSAAILADLVDSLGFDSVSLVGHDRGARVAHRWALDRPDQVDRVALLDILPTREVVHGLDEKSAQYLWHWLFHLQPELPELLIAGNEDEYLRSFLVPHVHDRNSMTEDAIGRYVDAFREPDVLRATLGDYRAGLTVDVEHDDADARLGHAVTAPLHVLWGAQGGLGGADVLGKWTPYAVEVSGAEIPDCGHFLPEEKPREVATELLAFMEAHSNRTGLGA